MCVSWSVWTNLCVNETLSWNRNESINCPRQNRLKWVVWYCQKTIPSENPFWIDFSKITSFMKKNDRVKFTKMFIFAKCFAKDYNKKSLFTQNHKMFCFRCNFSKRQLTFGIWTTGNFWVSSWRFWRVVKNQVRSHGYDFCVNYRVFQIGSPPTTPWGKTYPKQSF